MNGTTQSLHKLAIDQVYLHKKKQVNRSWVFVHVCDEEFVRTTNMEMMKRQMALICVLFGWFVAGEQQISQQYIKHMENSRHNTQQQTKIVDNKFLSFQEIDRLRKIMQSY